MSRYISRLSNPSPDLNSLYNIIIPLWKKFRGVYRNHSVCLYVRLCTDSSSARYLFFVLRMAYHIWCITISQCDAYIHVLYSMLILDLEVNFIGFLTCLCVWSIASVCFDIVISYMAHRSITIKRCVKKIHDHNWTLTFNLKVKVIGFLICLCVWSIASVCFDIVISYMAHRSITIKRCVEKIHDHNSTRTFNLKVKVILRVFNMSLCPVCNFCLLLHWHIVFGTWDYHHEGITFMIPVQCWLWTSRSKL